MKWYKFAILLDLDAVFFLFQISAMTDVEETIKRIQSQKGVVGVIIMDSIGMF